MTEVLEQRTCITGIGQSDILDRHPGQEAGPSLGGAGEQAGDRPRDLRVGELPAIRREVGESSCPQTGPVNVERLHDPAPKSTLTLLPPKAKELLSA